MKTNKQKIRWTSSRFRFGLNHFIINLFYLPLFLFCLIFLLKFIYFVFFYCSVYSFPFWLQLQVNGIDLKALLFCFHFLLPHTRHFLSSFCRTNRWVFFFFFEIWFKWCNSFISEWIRGAHSIHSSTQLHKIMPMKIINRTK